MFATFVASALVSVLLQLLPHRLAVFASSCSTLDSSFATAFAPTVASAFASPCATAFYLF